jgi:hypothetical protein
MSEPTPIAGTLNVTEDPDTVVGQLSLRSNFAFNHLLIATNAAREAHAIERQNAGAPFGPWFDRMMQLVPVSIVMAGAALDASVHELIQDILDGLTSIVPNESRTKLLADLLAERSGTLAVARNKINVTAWRKRGCRS